MHSILVVCPSKSFLWQDQRKSSCDIHLQIPVYCPPGTDTSRGHLQNRHQLSQCYHHPRLLCTQAHKDPEYNCTHDSSARMHEHVRKRRCQLHIDTRLLPFLASCIQIPDSVMSSYYTKENAMQQLATGLCCDLISSSLREAKNTEHQFCCSQHRRLA
nr:hypothetical protein Iba_chr12fCG5720 [Ipomoea batatas]